MPKSSTAMRTPSALSLLEPLDRRLDVGHDRALGDLEVDPARLDAGLAQDPVDVLLEVGSTRLPLRDVDADGDQRVQDAPLGHLPAGVLEHLQPERHHEPGLLGERDEGVRGHQPTLRVLPPHQRLEPDKASGLHRHDRLVVQHELVVVQRALKAGPKVEPVHGAACMCGSKMA